VGSEGYLTPNDDYETTVVILDELDKGASERDLAHRTGVTRSTVQRIANNREWYVGEPPTSV
jgi:transposase